MQLTKEAEAMIIGSANLYSRDTLYARIWSVGAVAALTSPVLLEAQGLYTRDEVKAMIEKEVRYALQAHIDNDQP